MEFTPDIFCSFMDSLKNMTISAPRNLTPEEVSNQTFTNGDIRIGENVYDKNGKFLGWSGTHGDQGCAGPNNSGQ